MRPRFPGRGSVDEERRAQRPSNPNYDPSSEGSGPHFPDLGEPRPHDPAGADWDEHLWLARQNLLYCQKSFFHQFDEHAHIYNDTDVDETMAKALHAARTPTLEGKRAARRWALSAHIEKVKRDSQHPVSRLATLHKHMSLLLSFQDDDGGDNMWVLLGFDLFMAAIAEAEAEIARTQPTQSQTGPRRPPAPGSGQGGPSDPHAAGPAPRREIFQPPSARKGGSQNLGQGRRPPELPTPGRDSLESFLTRRNAPFIPRPAPSLTPAQGAPQTPAPRPGQQERRYVTSTRQAAPSTTPRPPVRRDTHFGTPVTGRMDNQQQQQQQHQQQQQQRQQQTSQSQPHHAHRPQTAALQPPGSGRRGPATSSGEARATPAMRGSVLGRVFPSSSSEAGRGLPPRIPGRNYRSAASAYPTDPRDRNKV